MIDHVSVGVRDLARSTAFYMAVLAPLGMTRLVAREAMTGFGTKYPELWLNARPHMAPVDPATGSHICLRARSEAAVDDFHRLAIAHGGTDDGAPGLRPAAQVTYYAAFIRDPDGHRLEVMTVPVA